MPVLNSRLEPNGYELYGIPTPFGHNPERELSGIPDTDSDKNKSNSLTADGIILTTTHGITNIKAYLEGIKQQVENNIFNYNYLRKRCILSTLTNIRPL